MNNIIPKNCYLYSIALIVNLVSFSNGIALTWITPIIPKLEDVKFIDENPFGRILTSLELSWLAAVLALGATLGPFFSSKVADLIGRKNTLLISGSLHSISLIITACAKLLPLYYFARILTGIATGIGFTVTPMYFAEISENHNRGLLGCSMSIFLALGLNFTLIIGPYLPISTFSFACFFFPTLFLPLFFLTCPETPIYLATINKEELVVKSLRKLRCKEIEEIDMEVMSIMAVAQKNSTSSGSCKDLFFVKHLRKALLISVIVIILPQAAGIGAILSYMQLIFESANVHVEPQICVIIVGSFQLLGSIVSTLTIDRFGRRMLLLTSCFFISLTLFLFGLYFYLLEAGLNVDSISWLPLVSLVVFILMFNIGVGAVCWVVMSELFPTNVVSIASAISSSCCFLLSFIVVLVFPLLSDLIGIHWCFFIFAIICVLGGFFIFYMLPETKGKSIQEVQSLLGAIN